LTRQSLTLQERKKKARAGLAGLQPARMGGSKCPTARTPIGKAYRGAFNMTHGAELGGHVVRYAVEREGVDPGEVEDVILGCALPERATGGGDIGREIAVVIESRHLFAQARAHAELLPRYGIAYAAETLDLNGQFLDAAYALKGRVHITCVAKVTKANSPNSSSSLLRPATCYWS
jgi:hypothetical protein